MQLIPITKLIRNKSRNLYVVFSCRWGGQHVKLMTSPIAPPNIILKHVRIFRNMLEYFTGEEGFGDMSACTLNPFLTYLLFFNFYRYISIQNRFKQF